MSQVFISYKHTDEGFVNELERRIKENNIPAWKAGNNIPVGEVWRKTIDENIEKSFAVIVVMTPAARLSEYVTYEWSYAMGIGKPIIPVMLEKTEVHPKLEPLQHLNFTTRYAEPWGALLERLREINEAIAHNALSITPSKVSFDGYVGLLDEFKKVINAQVVETQLAKQKQIAEEAAKQKFVNVRFSWNGEETKIEVTEPERKMAWILYAELSTRITTRPLDPNHGLLREALGSLYTVFAFTRDVVKNVEPMQVSLAAFEMINNCIAPFNAKWHPKLKNYEDKRPSDIGAYDYEQAWEENAQFRKELVELQTQLREFSNSMREIAFTKLTI